MSFKLIAIRPLDGCNPKFLKNLTPNFIYKFYNDYKFYNNKELAENKSTNSDIIRIEYTANIPEDLYYQGDDEYKTKINVSAIVGKNGSGKSALVELLVASIVKMSLMIDDNFIDPKNLYYHRDEDILKEFIAKYEKSKNEDLNSINSEIYFYHKAPHLIENHNPIIKIRKLRLENGVISIFDFEKKFKTDTVFLIKNNIPTYLNRTKKTAKTNNQEITLSTKELEFFKDFFYTIVINYSHYGYNTRESGEWLKGVFHKNDGYQLPVVINPFREEGNIDINSEKNLASSRFLVNILQEKKLRTISENKTVSHISIEIDKSKFSEWDDLEKRDTRIYNKEEEKKEILESLINIFFDEKSFKITKTENSIYPFIRDYIFLKLYKITQYKKYKDFRGDKSTFMRVYESPSSFSFIDNDNLRDYFHDLEIDSSHITDKLRQALFFLKYMYLNDNDIFEKDKNEKLIKIDDLYENINYNFHDYIKNKLIVEQFLYSNFRVEESLPSIFKVNYFFDSKYSENNFNNFSSGEKQKIYSVHSVIYHLRNLKSVTENYDLENQHSLIYYKNVNIIFDEIELYAHPNYQKKFLNDLLTAINSVYQRYDNLNILFITHSPFILSDIPKQNVLFLGVDEETKKFKPQNFKRMNTFGANITDLLADSFFINDGLIGDFAKGKIEEIINWLNSILELKENIKKWELENKNQTNNTKIKNTKKKINNYLKKEIQLKSNDYKKYFRLIEIIDEPVLKHKLEDMYTEATFEFPRKEILKKQIVQIQKQLEELQNQHDNA
ncbi:hypothetical protein SAMN05421856_103126 [Chryseobacterium taichungense]|uniref:AAA ATPase domain-containing protein n=1 Tax=Chryseobacterium taichungense TaxID=295069 RepID=A0A1H7Y9R3_9FLAO|nr:hypothetical protein [Chryseobacterium taichungense]SEM42067.1 hypothetical protein SAMN05421856_103126 [Chryseobacterium taichungense]